MFCKIDEDWVAVVWVVVFEAVVEAVVAAILSVSAASIATLPASIFVGFTSAAGSFCNKPAIAVRVASSFAISGF